MHHQGVDNLPLLAVIVGLSSHARERIQPSLTHVLQHLFDTTAGQCLGHGKKQIDIPNTNTNAVEEAAGWVNNAERVDDFVHLHCLKNAWGGNFPVTVSGIYVWKAGGATAIKTVKSETAAEDGVYYNLQGQRVDNPTKGLFIHNG